jgi:hypothetical protein
MSKPRIIITCPETGIAVISKISYDDMVAPDSKPMLFKCPCGETHRLMFAGKHNLRREPRAVGEGPRAY